MFDQFVAAFNDTSVAAMDAYHATYMLGGTRSGIAELQRESGGFDQVSVRRSDGRTLEFSARQRSRGELVAGVFGLSRSDTTRVGVLRIQFMRSGMSLEDSTVWVSLRQRRP